MFDGKISVDAILDTAIGSDQQSSISGRFAPASQRTLKSSIHCSGVGLHSGAQIAMTLHPAPAGSGVVFRRTDVTDKDPLVPARWDHVSDTRLNTCISNADGVGVRTIEHLMAALAGAGIDNVLIDIDGGEVPVMDGSAQPFLFLIDCAGIAELAQPRRSIRIRKPVVVEDGDKSVLLAPSLHPSMQVEIDFPVAAIRRQSCTIMLSSYDFRREISRARTFGFEQEVAAMRAAGLGRGGSLENAVVISSDGEKVLNEDGLRYGDEFVRHKTLDAIGDLFLAGGPILGAYRGVRPGHALNNRLLRALFADASAWEWIQPGAAIRVLAEEETREAVRA